VFQGTVGRTISDYLGEYLSVLSYGAVGDGTTDDAPAINLAISKLISLNGRALYFPGGRTYVANSPLVLPAGVAKITVAGDGESSVIKRGANMPAGKGLFDIQGAKNVRFVDLKIDGNVTTSVGVEYGTMTGANSSDDPMHATLTANTSFWVHGGSQHIRFDGITVTHTGGYSILLDATAVADIDDVRILDCTFENNRPHLFGTNPADLNYGSWSSGIHYQGDGVNYSVKNLLIKGCTFRRNTGNCIWGHLYGFGKLHQNIRKIGNHFEDCGLDAIEYGGVVGGVCEGNTFRRIGYICFDDTSASVPAWVSGHNAVGIDTSGLVIGVNYVNNSFMSVNGGYMDLDGYSRGSVSGNTCIYPRVGENEYTEDNIAACGPPGFHGQNWTYGAQTSNSSNQAIAATDVTISGNTFVNMGGGAIKFYAARGCAAFGNNIDHESSSPGVPIYLGTIGTGANQRAYNNVVAGNSITYSPSAAAPAVFEDSQYGAFSSSDKNWVQDNRLFGNGNAYEFRKDANTSSVTGVVYSNNVSTLLGKSQITAQMEKAGTTSYLRHTMSSAGTADTVLSTLLDNGLYNASVNGGAGTGALTTGGRTTLAFMDSLATGKVVGDAFFGIKGKDATGNTYTDTDANKLDPTWGLLRFVQATKRFEMSVDATVDNTNPASPVITRIWSPLAGTATTPVLTPAGSTYVGGMVTEVSGALLEVGINDIRFGTPVTANPGCFMRWDGRGAGNEVFSVWQRQAGASSVFRVLWSDDSGVLRTGLNKTAIDQAGNITTVGVVSISTPDGSTGGLNVPNMSNYNAIQAPAGGVLGKSLTAGTNGIFIRDNASGGDNVPMQVLSIFNSTLANKNYCFNPIWIKSSAVNAVQVFDCDTASPTANVLGWGGIKLGTVLWEGFSADPGTTGTGEAALIYNKTTNKLRYSANGSAWADFSGAGSGTVAGTTGQIVATVAGSTTTLSFPATMTTIPQDLTVSRYLAVGGAAGVNAITVNNGYIQSQQGYVSVSGPLDMSSQVRDDSIKLFGTAYALGIRSSTMILSSGQLFRFETNLGSASLNAFEVAVKGGGNLVTISSGGNVGVAGFVQANSGINSISSVWNSIQATSGGIYGKQLLGGTFTADPGSYASGAMAHFSANGASHIWVESFGNGGAPVPAIIGRGARGSSASPSQVVAGDALMLFGGRGYTSSGWAGSMSAELVFQAAETFTSSAQGTDILFVTTMSGTAPGGGPFPSGRQTRLTILNSGVAVFEGFSGNQSIVLNRGYVNSAEGYFSANSSYETLKLSSGGAHVRSLHADSYIQVGQSSGVPSLTSGDSAVNGMMYYDIPTQKIVALEGGIWKNVIGGSSSGVSALNGLIGNLTLVAATSPLSGTPELTISASSTTITLGLPDIIHLNGGAGVAGLYLDQGWIQAAQGFLTTATNINAIQAPSGGISAGTGFYIGSTQVINSSGQFISAAGINVGSGAIAAQHFNVTGGFSGQDWDVFGTFTINGVAFSKLIFRGGILVSAG
jgi:hypothetical protein